MDENEDVDDNQFDFEGDEPVPCTKEEYAVAKHVRFNTPTHEGKLAGMTVKCFIASEAVNCLMDSKWAKGKAKPDSEILLSDRKSCVRFMHSMLEKGLFHRADKVEKKKDRDKKKKKKEIEEKEKKKEEEKEKKKEEEKEPTTEDKKSKKDKKTKKTEKEVEETKKEEKKEDDKKPKVRKFKLNMGEDQRFVDGNSIYVWIYDPIHPKTFTIGLLMLIGAAALCLFPLWPDWMRILVYWCSLLGASFVGFMLFLIVLRVIVFSIIWVLTLGKHHFWIFPNLTEDCGVIESFKPFIKHDVYDSTAELKEKAKKKRQEKEEQEEENDSENENDKNNDFEMIDSQEGDEINDTNNANVNENDADYGENEENNGDDDDDEEIDDDDTDAIESKKEK